MAEDTRTVLEAEGKRRVSGGAYSDGRIEGDGDSETERLWRGVGPGEGDEEMPEVDVAVIGWKVLEPVFEAATDSIGKRDGIAVTEGV